LIFFGNSSTATATVLGKNSLSIQSFERMLLTWQTHMIRASLLQNLVQYLAQQLWLYLRLKRNLTLRRHPPDQSTDL
jgi:hypothetical protein